MNVIDACVLGMLAVIDFAIIVRLRQRRARAARAERIMRSLECAIQREIAPAGPLTRGHRLLQAG